MEKTAPRSVICLGNEWEFTVGGVGRRLKAPERHQTRGIGAAKHQRQSSAAGSESHVWDSHGDICLKTQYEEPRFNLAKSHIIGM